MKGSGKIIWPLISVAIIVTGVLWIFSLMMQDYRKGDEMVEEKMKEVTIFENLKIAATYKQKGNQEKAIDMFSAILKLDPENYDGRMMLAETYYETCIEKDTLCDEALWQLNILVEKFPTMAEPYELRSEILFLMNDTVAGQRDKAKAIELRM